MKSLITALAVAVALAAQSAVQAGPVGPTPTHTNILVITKLSADHTGNVTGIIQNKTATPVVATFTLAHWNGSAWITVRTGSNTVAANKTITITGVVPRTKVEQKVKLDVVSTTANASASLVLTMKPKKTYVLQYKTSGWVQVAYQFQKTTSELIGTAVEKPAAECRKLGFKTRIRREHQTVLFGTDSYRTYADARLDEMKERTFESKQERDLFNRALYKLVPSYTNAGPGLFTKEVDR